MSSEIYSIPMLKSSVANSLDHSSTAFLTSKADENCFPLRCSLRWMKKNKSKSARPGLWDGWFKTSQPKDAKKSTIFFAVWSQALLCKRQTPFVIRPLFLFLMARWSFWSVLQYQSALIYSLFGKKWISNIPLRSQNLVAMISFHLLCFEFVCIRGTKIPPLHWLSFAFRSVVSNPCFVTCYNRFN